nr:hypothetical protein [Tanacetum cinerariifolium]
MIFGTIVVILSGPMVSLLLLFQAGSRLQKRVLSFVHVHPPRTALDIADGIYKCLKEWEIEGKIFSISVDNAAYNDKGLSKISDVIDEVREAVKYINYSEARRQIISNVAHQLQIHDRKLMLDVPTRWNSTYDMLSLTLNFKDVFPRSYEGEVRQVLGGMPPAYGYSSGARS